MITHGRALFRLRVANRSTTFKGLCVCVCVCVLGFRVSVSVSVRGEGCRRRRLGYHRTVRLLGTMFDMYHSETG